MNPIDIAVRSWHRRLVIALGGILGMVALVLPPVRSADAAVPSGGPVGTAYWPPLDDRELLAIDEPMKAFFDRRVERNAPAPVRLREIVTAILQPDGLGFVYDPSGTYHARETFRRRRGNCQAFAFLVTAVARAYDLDVSFQDISTMQQWNRFDRFIAAVRHTNVRMRNYDDYYIVDLRPDLGRPTFGNDRYVVKDERAIAHFYTSAGFFRLVQGDGDGALRLMQRAAEADPTSAIAWANLGNLHLQRAEAAPARSCFERSLQLDTRMDEALTGLVRVLRMQGGSEDLKLADKHERRAEAYRNRNPYYVRSRGVEARHRGDLATAENCLRRAISLKKDEPLFHEELIAVLREKGLEKEAAGAEAKLAKLRVRLARTGTHVMP